MMIIKYFLFIYPFTRPRFIL